MMAESQKSSPQPTPKRRRWWIGIVFAILAITVVMAVALLSRPATPAYPFLKGGHVDSTDEAIHVVIPGGMTYIRSTLITVEQPYAFLKPKAEAELKAFGFSIVDSRADTVWISNVPGGQVVVLTALKDKTVVRVSEVRSPTTLDRFRVWLKSLVPSKNKLRQEAARSR